MRSTIVRFNVKKNRTRVRIAKVSNRLRLTVYKSGKYIYAQIIDDKKSVTLVSASTLNATNKKSGKFFCNIKNAQLVGNEIARKASALDIKEVVFDRGGYKYHGVVKALADAARSSLSF